MVGKLKRFWLTGLGALAACWEVGSTMFMRVVTAVRA